MSKKKILKTKRRQLRKETKYDVKCDKNNEAEEDGMDKNYENTIKMKTANLK